MPNLAVTSNALPMRPRQRRRRLYEQIREAAAEAALNRLCQTAGSIRSPERSSLRSNSVQRQPD